ncbi:integrase/recombinase xerD homolog [Eublepharis macularius]|uniref:Integrase/recombinase xerD homolog n=1 Tax=Eublepharis macularius TaxID=481883 RepID=A0AA97J646_EUBMA|nr:integrase/recombinase xerD homolog [Eublepharis macularius]
MQGVLSSIAPSTLRAYSAAEQRFWAFAREVGGPTSWPAPQDMVLRYLAYLRALGRAPSTMRGDLAAISFFSKALGFEDPCDCFAARRAVEGWRRLAPPPPDKRRPITLPILREITLRTKDICWSEFEAILFRAAFSLAFFGALRVGELVCASREDTSGRALQVGDVSWGRGGLTINIRRSKTDQLGRGASIFLRPAAIAAVCPVRALEEYLALRPSGPAPLLVHADCSPVSRFQFAAVLRACLAAAGLPQTEFGTHSFRIGAATSASEWGLASSQIQAIGRWRSSAYRTYVRPSRAGRR